MATPPASDEQTDGPGDGPDAAVPAAGPFNALTDDLNDLRVRHQHCWLWPQISLEIDRLDDVLKDGRQLLEPLITDRPDWAVKACIGIARSNPAIHQHVERYDSYAQAARSLWTTFIPATPPTLTDAQIYAVMAMHEARMAAETYCEIAAGIEEEMAQARTGHDDEDEIVDLRCDIAGWERWHWHYAAQQVGSAERFLLMASFAASAPDMSAIKKAESQMATLERKARAARAEVAPYRQGRQKGAVSNLTRALQEVVRSARSKKPEAVLAKKNMTELAKAEKMGLARMQKMLKLARLAPDIVEEIARGRQRVGLSLLFFVENPLPDDWNAQRDVIGGLAN